MYLDGYASLGRRRFILFLRRFSSFADRTIVGEVIRAAPRGVPVVFIASPGDHLANWDPFTWAFAGFRLIRPRANLPVQIRTSEADWREVVETCIGRAACVAVEVSVSSVSVEEELEMVRKHGDLGRVVALSGARAGSDHPWTSDHSSLGMVRYEPRFNAFLVLGKVFFALLAVRPDINHRGVRGQPCAGRRFVVDRPRVLCGIDPLRHVADHYTS